MAGPPTMTLTPTTAIAIAIHVRRPTGSPMTVPSAAARMGSARSASAALGLLARRVD
jgi:hypothetical protein